MANQIIIDIGAAANDGTGDPLRTAFNYVNENFSNVWNTGLPTSNVGFSGNRIITVNTNGNLILAPNGIGKVVANVDILPNISNVRNLGSLTNRWSTLYAQYLNVTGDVDFGGSVTVQGNLVVEGDTIQIGNIVTDTKTIQLSNTAVTANAANGSGITVGANDNIATILYNSSANVWNFNVGITAPSISAPGGNGQVLYNKNGVIGTSPFDFNFDESTYTLYVVTGSFSGNAQSGANALYAGIPGYTVLGSDVQAQFTGNVDNYTQINFQNTSDSPQASGDYIITADNGNDSTHFINLGMAGSAWDGSQLNSLGNALSPNSGYLYVQDGSLVIGTKVGNTANVVTFNTDGTVSSTGNISAPYFLGNGSQLTGIETSRIFNGNSQVTIPAPNGATFIDQDGQGVVRFAYVDNGGLDTYGEIAGQQNGVLLLSDIPTGEASLKLNRDTGNLPGAVLSTRTGNIELSTNTQFGSNTWTFEMDGSIRTPGNLVIGTSPGPGGSIISQDEASLAVVGVGANSNVIAGWTESTTAPGNIAVVSFNGSFGGPSNVAISTGNNGGTQYDWKFGNDGNLTIPGSIVGTATIDIDNRGTGNTADIRLYSADDITLQARDRTVGDDIEGGDINLFAGDGSPDDAGGGTGSGGDIQIIGGVGGLADVSSGGQGGFVRLDAGRGGDGSATAAAGRGGDAYLSAGSGGAIGGTNGGAGGNVTITAGDTTDVARDRGSIILNAGGGGDETTVGGYVRINIPSAGTNPGGNWTFEPTGNLTLPQGGIINEGPSPSFLGAAVTITPANGSDADQQLKIYPTFAEGNHLHLTTGNLYNTELYVGDDNLYVKLANTGDVVINSNDSQGNIAQWTFGVTGGLTVPVTNINGSAGEAAQFVGTRKLVNGIGFSNPYAVALSAGGTPTVAYTASSGLINSVKVTFAVQSSGSGFQWEQFDVVAVASQDIPNTVNYVVSNRVKAASAIGDTAVTAAIVDNKITITLNLDAGQTSGGTASFDAVEFGLMID